MAPYLPQGGAGGGGSPYSEGGALYALGLIHANHGEGIKQFLRDSLRSTNVEVIAESKFHIYPEVSYCHHKTHEIILMRRLFNMVHAWVSVWQP